MPITFSLKDFSQLEDQEIARVAALRYKVFIQKNHWEILGLSAHGQRELDCYDRPGTWYVMACDINHHIVGFARLIKADMSCPLMDVDPHVRQFLPADCHNYWEFSRFFVLPGQPPGLGSEIVRQAARLAERLGGKGLIGSSRAHMRRLLQRGGITSDLLGIYQDHHGKPCHVLAMSLGDSRKASRNA